MQIIPQMRFRGFGEIKKYMRRFIKPSVKFIEGSIGMVNLPISFIITQPSWGVGRSEVYVWIREGVNSYLPSQLLPTYHLSTLYVST